MFKPSKQWEPPDFKSRGGCQSYSIVFNANQSQPQEKVLISYSPKVAGMFENDVFNTTFAFEKETTLMMSNPRELLEIADEVIKEIKK